MSKEYKLYLKSLRVNKILIYITQILILFLIIFIWEYLFRKNIINSFIYSSPSKIIKTIIELYKSNNLFNHILISINKTIIDTGNRNN